MLAWSTRAYEVPMAIVSSALNVLNLEHLSIKIGFASTLLKPNMLKAERIIIPTSRIINYELRETLSLNLRTSNF